jgi:hypothetical protein
VVAAGSVLDARLIKTGRNAVAVANGQEYLLPKGAGPATEGAIIRIEVTRELLGGIEPWKRPLARLTDMEAGLAIGPGGRPAGAHPVDELAASGWDELVDEARSGLVSFAGGELSVSVTPAMTLIDIDGNLPPAELLLAGARAAARVIRRHCVGGSIGIDFPTVGERAARVAAAEQVDRHLPQPFERTAVNGFGFMQIVRPRGGASTFELAADRSSFEARALLRRAGSEIGSIRIVAHPAVVSVLEAQPGWTERLSRQVGGPVALRAEPSLAMSAGYAEPA